MWPLGSYDRLVHEIKYRENRDLPVTFGLLIADYRQQESREYIINYIDRFNYVSGRFINFYLPGYLEENDWTKEDGRITITRSSGKEYYLFNKDVFLEFLNKYSSDFNVPYPYTPELILLEYDRGHFSKAKKLIIELDSDGTQIKKAGALFEKIFDAAKQTTSLDGISKEMLVKDFKGSLFQQMVGLIDNKALTALYEKGQTYYKYKLK